jgi:hypothetical protein
LIREAQEDDVTEILNMYLEPGVESGPALYPEALFFTAAAPGFLSDLREPFATFAVKSFSWSALQSNGRNAHAPRHCPSRL